VHAVDELLPHYERELAFLRAHAGSFARQYPKIAGRLMLSGDVGEDPHVERMIEAFALLTSRIHKRLDDDFPLFTETFLDVLYPHYLRPFPSCSIARFDLGSGASQMSKAAVVPRGTMLVSKANKGVTCKFRTAYDVPLLPLRLASAAFRGSVSAPDGTPLPKGSTSVLSLQLELTSAQVSWAALGAASLRFYIDGEGSQVSTLREALTSRVTGVLVQSAATGPWRSGGPALPASVGFAEDEALIDFSARSHPAYRLLTEYFAFAEKFNFIDIPLPQAVLQAGAAPVTLHLVMGGIRADSDEARLLETVGRDNLLLGCTPVVNLFRQNADPIRVTHQSASYPLLPDARRAFAYEVYSIDKVFRVRQSAQGESIDEFRPFYSLRHDDLSGEEGEESARYWYAHRDETVAEHSPGFEYELAIVDADFNPASPQTDTLSIEVTATNRDLPAMLSFGNAGGDLFLEGGSVAREIMLLRRPTQPHRFERGRGALWRLISHLSLNHLSLSAGGVDAIREMLRLYDLPRSAVTRRQIEALVAIDFKPATAWLPGQPFPTFVRGTEVRLTLDEQGFVGTGLRLFVQVLDHFFGLYVHANSFTQLAVVSARTQEEIIRCPRRSGDSPLL
jgi:type VI secretion system protein ImpG